MVAYNAPLTFCIVFTDLHFDILTLYCILQFQSTKNRFMKIEVKLINRLEYTFIVTIT